MVRTQTTLAARPRRTRASGSALVTPVSFRVVLALWLTSASFHGCQRGDGDPAGRTADQGEQVLLRGSFVAVAKTASGAVDLRARGDDYELCLENVTIAHDGPVRVYLVGLDDAPSTAAVDRAPLKYDIGPLGAEKHQCITLPSAPDPTLRSVVLWNPRYGANLAAAQLKE